MQESPPTRGSQRSAVSGRIQAALVRRRGAHENLRNDPRASWSHLAGVGRQAGRPTSDSNRQEQHSHWSSALSSLGTRPWAHGSPHGHQISRCDLAFVAHW